MSIRLRRLLLSIGTAAAFLCSSNATLAEDVSSDTSGSTVSSGALMATGAIAAAGLGALAFFKHNSNTSQPTPAPTPTPAPYSWSDAGGPTSSGGSDKALALQGSGANGTDTLLLGSSGSGLLTNAPANGLMLAAAGKAAKKVLPGKYIYDVVASPAANSGASAAGATATVVYVTTAATNLGANELYCSLDAGQTFNLLHSFYGSTIKAIVPSLGGVARVMDSNNKELTFQNCAAMAQNVSEWGINLQSWWPLIPSVDKDMYTFIAGPQLLDNNTIEVMSCSSHQNCKQVGTFGLDSGSRLWSMQVDKSNIYIPLSTGGFRVGPRPTNQTPPSQNWGTTIFSGSTVTLLSQNNTSFIEGQFIDKKNTTTMKMKKCSSSYSDCTSETSWTDVPQPEPMPHGGLTNFVSSATTTCATVSDGSALYCSPSPAATGDLFWTKVNDSLLDGEKITSLSATDTACYVLTTNKMLEISSTGANSSVHVSDITAGMTNAVMLKPPVSTPSFYVINTTTGDYTYSPGSSWLKISKQSNALAAYTAAVAVDPSTGKVYAASTDGSLSSFSNAYASDSKLEAPSFKATLAVATSGSGSVAVGGLAAVGSASVYTSQARKWYATLDQAQAVYQLAYTKGLGKTDRLIAATANTFGLFFVDLSNNTNDGTQVEEITYNGQPIKEPISGISVSPSEDTLAVVPVASNNLSFLQYYYSGSAQSTNFQLVQLDQNLTARDVLALDDGTQLVLPGDPSGTAPAPGLFRVTPATGSNAAPSVKPIPEFTNITAYSVSLDSASGDLFVHSDKGVHRISSTGAVISILDNSGPGFVTFNPTTGQVVVTAAGTMLLGLPTSTSGLASEFIVGSKNSTPASTHGDISSYKLAMSIMCKQKNATNPELLQRCNSLQAAGVKI